MGQARLHNSQSWCVAKLFLALCRWGRGGDLAEVGGSPRGPEWPAEENNNPSKKTNFLPNQPADWPASQPASQPAGLRQPVLRPESYRATRTYTIYEAARSAAGKKLRFLLVYMGRREAPPAKKSCFYWYILVYIGRREAPPAKIRGDYCYKVHVRVAP